MPIGHARKNCIQIYYPTNRPNLQQPATLYITIVIELDTMFWCCCCCYCLKLTHFLSWNMKQQGETKRTHNLPLLLSVSSNVDEYCVNVQNIVRQQRVIPFSYTLNLIFTWMMLRMEFFHFNFHLISFKIEQEIIFPAGKEMKERRREWVRVEKRK